jgi:hypothetical protein
MSDGRWKAMEPSNIGLKIRGGLGVIVAGIG